MKKIYLIGIGPGDPQYLTQQAINTMKKVDLFIILEKESEKNRELIQIRKRILEDFLPEGNYRTVVAKIPERKRGGKGLKEYKERVAMWRRQKAEILANLIKNEMEDDESGAILIWGDPAFYDGHIEILHYVLKEGLAEFEFEVIPGITSIQELTAKHKIPLNSVGESIFITTGRRLREISPEDIENTVILLDNYLTYRNFKDTDLHIYWGAYLGLEKESIISGRLNETVDEIIKIRNEAKKRNSWIMETYILRQGEK